MASRKSSVTTVTVIDEYELTAKDVIPNLDTVHDLIEQYNLEDGGWEQITFNTCVARLRVTRTSETH